MSRLDRIDRIVVHHSASSIETKADEIVRWHTEGRGWDDVGYHAIIEGDGTLVQGRSVGKFVRGAHALGVNATTLGLCLVGNNTRTEDAWTPAQAVTANRWLRACMLVFELEPEDVVGHRDAGTTATVCPGLSTQALRLLLL